MPALSRLGLGTAQFGAWYGVSNRSGRPSEQEIGAIIEAAVANGMGTLDTAAAYGDAESLIGRCLPANHGLRIVTKVGPFPEQRFEQRHQQKLLDDVARSLDRLRVDHVHGLLIHHASDFCKPGAEYLIAGLKEAKAWGWAKRIGGSVYGAKDLATMEARFQPDLVQLPLNVLDRRLLDAGHLVRLKSLGTEIHARSAFLQGLLLIAPDQLPAYFAPVSGALADIASRWGHEQVDALAGCLGFVFQQSEVDAVIVGCNRRAEVEEIVAAVASLAGRRMEFGSAAPADVKYLDPSLWPDFKS